MTSLEESGAASSLKRKPFKRIIAGQDALFNKAISSKVDAVKM